MNYLNEDHNEREFKHLIIGGILYLGVMSTSNIGVTDRRHYDKSYRKQIRESSSLAILFKK